MSNASNNPSTTQSRHPLRLFVTFITIVFQITHALMVLQLPEQIQGALVLPPALQVVIALMWAGLFSWAAVSLFRRRAYAVGYADWLFVSFILYSLLRLVLFAQADYDRQRLPFLVGLGLLLLAVPLGSRVWLWIRQR